ncbi:MAG: carboxy-S-adenosyl-L-methionine synthase CmoA [Desulfobacteraceae bacterium 4572_35.1]|nr:MAG: carboxy-S-adenosyl-L-methionine synthase CmoA [Desulfobacteraceae bacterium 4572_35.1]
MQHKDAIYSQTQDVAPFEFNEKVVNVFDDMITRSVPLYRESLQRQAQLAAHYYQPGSCIYDLGCSNGNFGLLFLQEIGAIPFKMQAIDNSRPMLEQYQRRLQPILNSKQIDINHAALEEVKFTVDSASVVVINLTLQFLALNSRDKLLQDIYDALRPGGILLLSEKVIHADTQMAELQQDWYYRLKKENGYSQLEISQKREALENVLIPETLEQHQQRLNNVGFKKIEIWLKWFHFTSFLCVKE